MFTRGNILKALGLIVILLLIWFASDYLPWLESPGNMFLAMAVPVSLLAAWEVFRRARAAQANSKLTNAVVGQAQADRRPSADVAQLRERFEEAIAMLKQQKKRGGHGLYELPWYVIVGAPGSGKTTALKYSGLKFPLEQRSGKGALRGVGGTRNCDWWFTEEAVLLDTAGRYTTQDSDAAADSAGWAEFLALLKRYRKRRPLNGVLLAISAQDLMTQGQAGREAHITAARRRLNELNKELRIQLPVYVLVTKCDLIAGFSEYFEDMSQQDRAQVLGVTFPKDVTVKGTAAGEFPAEFDAVVQRLNERVYARLESEADGRRRASIFGFPQQLASLREGLSEFIGEVFESTRFDQRVLLRGVYFTSGTQEGTPIDRLLGALSRRFSVAAEAVAPGARGKAYFIERLMKDVILAESGLAGVSRRLEVQTAIAQFGLYFGMLAVGAIGLLLLTISYRTNYAFLEEFKGRTNELSRTLPAAGATAIQARPRLDQIRTLLDGVPEYRDERSWLWRRWGLDQTTSVEEAIGGFYEHELQSALVETVKQRIEQRLQSLLGNGEPLDLYLTLRAYLMLKGTSAPHFDPKEVQSIAMAEWEKLDPGDPMSAPSLDNHFSWLLDRGLRESELNDSLVSQARNAIPDSAAPDLILARVIRLYEKDLEVDGQSPPVIQMPAFRARNGKPLGEGMLHIFTKEGFQAADDRIKDTERQLRDEKWFWADRKLPEVQATRNTVWDKYEAAYINQWDRLLKDLGLPSGPEVAEFITKLTSENGGLKVLLQTIDLHTALRPEVYEEPKAGFLASLGAAITREVGAAMLKAQKLKDPHGAKVTIHFIPIHRLVTPPASGGQAAIDAVLAKLKPVADGVTKSAPGGVSGGSPGQGAVEVADAVRNLKQTTDGLSGAAESLTRLMDELTKIAVAQAGKGAATDVYRPLGNFLAECRPVINGYPFVKTATNEVTTDDLRDLLGAQFNKMTSELAPYIEERNGRYASKTLPDGRMAASDDILNKINEIDQIRQALMSNGNFGFAFDVSVRDMTGRTTEVTISETLFGGRKFRFSGQAMPTMTAQWPANGDLDARFDDGSGRTESVKGGNGPWNLFRLLDQAATVTRNSDTDFLVTLATPGGGGAELRLQPKRIRNPLVLYKSGALQSFRCGG